MMRKWIPKQIEIKRFRFQSDRCFVALGKFSSEAKSTAAVIEVLSPERAKCQSMAVVDYSFRGEDHAITLVKPALAKLTVFGSAQHRIKTACDFECFCR